MTEQETPRKISEKLIAEQLSRFGAKPDDPILTHRQHPQESDNFRTEFERDYTRIVHSRAFRRLRHKTQVFVSPKNDHLCTRLEHSLHVGSVAKTIARALNLNEDLVLAIAVGHDLGHAPFGHKGEHTLHNLVSSHGFCFQHELQSLRVVDELDSPYRNQHNGLNLTFAVRDGIACHYGEGFEACLKPDRSKEPDDLLQVKRGDIPATLEGCVVRFADKVAYIGRDLEDAIAVGIIERHEIPKNVQLVLGNNNGKIIGSLIADIVSNSEGEGHIRVGPEVHEALNRLYQFSKNRIYDSQIVTGFSKQIKNAMTFMFDEFVKLIRKAQRSEREFPCKDDNSCVSVLDSFLSDDIGDWQGQKPERLAADFIAGMTDSYFIETFKELFLPSSTV